MRPTGKSGLFAAPTGLALILGIIGHSLAQESAPAAPLLISECKAQLPEDKQYTLNIDIYINTREGENSTLDLVLLDDAMPESLAIPEGTEGFLNCVLGTLGFSEVQV